MCFFCSGSIYLERVVHAVACDLQGHVVPGQVYNTTVVTRTAGPAACYPATAYPPCVPQSYPLGNTVPPSGAYVPPAYPAPVVPPHGAAYPSPYPAASPYAPGPAPPPGNYVKQLVMCIMQYSTNM